MNIKILDKNVQEFIHNNLNIDVTSLILKKQLFEEVSNVEIANQILSKRKCEKKLPTWFNHANIYYPLKLSIEQCSSEITANFKSKLIIGKSVFDASGGFGVDSFYFSKVVENVTHCEINKELSNIVKFNFKTFGNNKVKCFHADAITWLKKSKQNFATIYIDPARRKENNKVFNFKDCEPNIIENQELLLLKADRIIIKAAPMLDIKFALSQLKNVSFVYVVSYKNECKELLFIIDKKSNGFEPLINCVILKDFDHSIQLTSTLSEEKNLLTNYSNISEYIFEPDVSLLKAGFFKKIAQLYAIEKLHPNTHLYTGKKSLENFPGKIFKVNSVMFYTAFEKLKIKITGNVVSKNFGMEAEKLKLKFKIKPHSDKFIIFTTNHLNEKVVIDCLKVN